MLSLEWQNKYFNLTNSPGDFEQFEKRSVIVRRKSTLKRETGNLERSSSTRSGAAETTVLSLPEVCHWREGRSAPADLLWKPLGHVAPSVKDCRVGPG